MLFLQMQQLVRFFDAFAIGIDRLQTGGDFRFVQSVRRRNGRVSTIDAELPHQRLRLVQKLAERRRLVLPVQAVQQAGFRLGGRIDQMQTAQGPQPTRRVRQVLVQQQDVDLAHFYGFEHGFVFLNGLWL